MQENIKTNFFEADKVALRKALPHYRGLNANALFSEFSFGQMSFIYSCTFIWLVK